METSSLYKPSQLSVEVTSIMGLNQFLMHNSASRMQMFNGHIGQRLVFEGASVRTMFSGIERELANCTFRIEMPHDAIIVALVPKYRQDLAAPDAPNPLTTIIYQTQQENGLPHFTYIDLPRWHCMHQYFGFNYDIQSDANMMYVGSRVPKGTVLANSPAVTAKGDYKLGIELNVIGLSLPEVIEDGVVISRSLQRRLTTRVYGTRMITINKNKIALNLYGDKARYKCFPDIGDCVRPDGVLFATRDLDPKLGIVQLAPKSLRKISMYDQRVVAPAGSKIIDVVVHKSGRDKSNIPLGLTDQFAQYHNRLMQYYKGISDWYDSAKRQFGIELANLCSNELHELVRYAKGVISDTRIQREYTMNRIPIDDWVVEVTFEAVTTPTEGSKLTGMHGNKGVIVAIWEDEDMPRDEWGNVADLIKCSDSYIKRMNLGAPYEAAIGAFRRDLTATIKPQIEQALRTNDKVALNQIWQQVLRFYQILAPLQYKAIVDLNISPEQHLRTILDDTIRLFMPPDNPVMYREAIRQLRAEKFPICHSHITYRGQSGRIVTTKAKNLIGTEYYLLLEKMAGSAAAGSSFNLQMHGLPTRLSAAQKHSCEVRLSATRFGEAEWRIFMAYTKYGVAADILDMTNNTEVHREIVRNIHKAQQPTNIPEVVDREKFPVGNGKPLQLVKHFLGCAGTEFVKCQV